MWYETELMRSILKSDYAKDAVDKISGIYGKAYYVLWLFQVIGIEFDFIESFVQDLKEKQLTVESATWMLDYYEKCYGIETNKDLSYEERRARIMLKNNAGPLNPDRIAFVIKTLTGRDVNVIERIAPNTFEIDIENGSSEADVDKIFEVANQIKQAHTIFKVVFDSSINVAIRASPKSYKFSYNMTSGRTKTGKYPVINTVGKKAESNIAINNIAQGNSFPYPLSGTQPDVNNIAVFDKLNVLTENEEQKAVFGYNETSERSKTGTFPDVKHVGKIENAEVEIESNAINAEISYPITGTIPGENTIGSNKTGTLEAETNGKAYSVSFKICGKNKL